MTENVEHYRNQISLARTEIKNLRQQLSALKHEHLKEIKQIKSVLNVMKCSDCAEQQGSAVTTNCNSEATTSRASQSEDVIPFHPIGVIETTFQNKRGVPRQPSILAKAKGAVVVNPGVFNNPEHALSGLEEFSHMWIIFHFHATESTNVLAKVAPPRLGGERRGVFSTRSPHRPCPIGLSLVKIHSIEGNKVFFNGVDMVNGTPVLDIKPYIPQYDYPSQFDNNMTMLSLVRPPTEGISDITENVATLNVRSAPSEMRSISPRLTHPIGIDTSSPISPSPYDEETSPHDNITPISPSPDSPSSIELLDGASYMNTPPVRRPETERGAPDGQERFTPPQSAQLVNLRHDGIRVAPWISNPPSQTYEVRFSDDALNRLNELIGSRAQAFKTTIEALLSEDPRSHYVRTRYPDHEYSCVLEDLSLSCVFESSTSLCTIIAVRSAEDLQN